MISRKINFPNVIADRRLCVALVHAMLREQHHRDQLSEQITALQAEHKKAADKAELLRGFVETLKKSDPEYLSDGKAVVPESIP